MQRLRILVHGAVQGVGFRPFAHRLASELGLAGQVQNTGQGVNVEVEGPAARCQEFLERLSREHPPLAAISSLESTWLDAAGYTDFQILESDSSSAKSAVILPDIATCPECLNEVLDPSNRRFRYPFTNCTHCGPRFSILLSLPYDRGNTTMRGFSMCEECMAEYHDPGNRRFHAQPNACPCCGPQIALWDAQGRALAGAGGALNGAVDHLRSGGILAVKGVGGFQLMVLAEDSRALERLRLAKQREEKPFAVMFPSMKAVASACRVSQAEARLLSSSHAPIVLLRATGKGTVPQVSPQVAPGNPYLGVMLPYSPLHHLILAELGKPVVATSGNLKDEPICTDEHEALNRLGNIADFFLVHNRPMARPIDDSVVQVVLDREMVLRRARGYAPLPVQLKLGTANIDTEQSASILGVGAHLKNTVALLNGSQVFLSQHIGDLETDLACTAFENAARDLPGLYGQSPRTIAADKHPDYASSRWAAQAAHQKPGCRIRLVQHHLAHVTACMAENELIGPLLGVAWDGTGLGDDGTIWGGEFFSIKPGNHERVALFGAFPLPGGDRAAREPRRCALGWLYGAFGKAGLDRLPPATLSAFTKGELTALSQMLLARINAPLTSSVGRLFDAMASLTGLRQVASFEGQAAMELEFAAIDDVRAQPYPFKLRGSAPIQIDLSPLLSKVLNDLASGVQVAEISARFHCTLAHVVLKVAQLTGHGMVALGGGCWQNRFLLAQTATALQKAGVRCYWPQRVPPNDGGISLGQVAAVAMGLA